MCNLVYMHCVLFELFVMEKKKERKKKERKKERKKGRKEDRKMMNKIEIFMFGFLTL